MNRIFTSRWIVGGLISVGLLAACSQNVDHTVAGAIKNALPKAIGPAQNYSVTVETNPVELAKGHLQEVKIVGTEVNLSPQLLMDELDIDATDIRADVLTQKVKSVGQVTFTAVVGQDSLNHYISALPSDSPQAEEHLKVNLNDHSITATVLVRALGVRVPASVTGTFQLESDSQELIDFIPDRGSLSIIPLPQFALKLALDKINPVIDLSTSTIPVTVDSVTIQSGKIIITGEADLQDGLVQNT